MTLNQRTVSSITQELTQIELSVMDAFWKEHKSIEEIFSCRLQEGLFLQQKAPTLTAQKSLREKERMLCVIV